MSLDFSDPVAVARASAEAMWEKDLASRSLGMSLDGVGPGEATLSLTVTAGMTNGHKTCHGGYIFTLADSAFAFACNSHGELTVAASIAVDFLAPGRKDDLLTAQAHEVSKAGRTGLYDCEVTNQHGERIAVFRGRSHTMKGKPAF